MNDDGILEESSQGATEYLLILAAVLVVVAIAVYHVSTGGPSFPPLSATPANQDNEIRINVESGSIPTGDWQYSVSTSSGSYTWVDGGVKLQSPYVSLGTYAADNYYVSLKHKPSGYLYFTNRTVEIT